MKTASERLLDLVVTKMQRFKPCDLAAASSTGVATIRDIMHGKRVPSLNTLADIERAIEKCSQKPSLDKVSQCCIDNKVSERAVRRVMTMQAAKRSSKGLPAYTLAEAAIEAIGIVKIDNSAFSGVN